jgi:phosphate transport system substrate-binding protein
MKRTFSLILLGLTMATLVGCSGGGADRKGGDKGGAGDKRIDAGGASFINPMMTKWTSEYRKAKGVEINYTSIGSAGGINKMIDKVYAFGCTDAPMTDEQLADAKKVGGEVIHIPLAMGAVVPTYNLPGVEKPVRFTGEVLAAIYLGKIRKWNDPELQKLQEKGVELPDLEIAPVHRSDGSGTTYIFSEYLSKVSPEWKKKVGFGTSLEWPAGIGIAANGNQGVAQKVDLTKGAIGYNELIYALGKKHIKYGPVKNREGNYVMGSLESVTKAVDGSLTEIPKDLRFSLTDPPGKDSYPISSADWAILFVNQPADKADTVRNFLHWVTHEGQEMCAALHFARLPEALIKRVEEKLKEIKTAS